MYPAQPTPRTRLAVRRIAITLAGVVLMLAWYVGSYGAVEYLVGRGVSGKSPSLNNAARQWIHRTVFAPIHIGAEAGVPLCNRVRWFGIWCYDEGSGVGKWVNPKYKYGDPDR